MPAADVERVTTQMENIFGISPADVLLISAKTGQGVPDVLRAIVDRIPPPDGTSQEPLRGLLFDSWKVYYDIVMYLFVLIVLIRYDRYRGVISLISLTGGVLGKGIFRSSIVSSIRKIIPLYRR